MYQNINMAIIGNKIKELRTKRGITAEELAKEIKTSTSAINMYECGQRIPRDEVKIRIADFFRVSVESIFYLKQ